MAAVTVAVIHAPGVPLVTINGVTMRDYRHAHKPNRRTGTCRICGGDVSGRADKLYCSPACRKKAHRRAAKAGPRGPRLSSVAAALLASRYLVGTVSHTRDLRGLLVPRNAALEELNATLPEPVTEWELKAAMKEADILDYGDTLPAAARGLRQRSK